jgi:tetrahydromethanopterin S-methyltransferase subunit G
MEANIDKAIKKQGFEKGLLLGVILLVLGIFTYYLIVSLTTSMMVIVFAPVLTSIILPLFIAVLFTLNLRKSIGGFWDFRRAVTGIFIMLLTSQMLSTLGKDVVFAKLVEPQMADKMANSIISATTVMMEKSGMDQTQIDEKIAEVEKEFNQQKSPTIGHLIQGLVISIIMVFVLSLLFAAIFKKDPPKNGLDTAIDPALG